MATELEVSVEKHEKTVLVDLNERARPVKFSGGVTQLTASIKRSFEDVLVRGDEQLILQVGLDYSYIVYIWLCTF